MEWVFEYGGECAVGVDIGGFDVSLGWDAVVVGR